MRALTSVRLIAIVAAVVMLSLGSRFFVPITLGVLLAGVLHTPVAALRRFRVPAPVGAAIAVLCTLGAIVLAVTLLEPPLRALTRDVPKAVLSARTRLVALGIHLPGEAGTGEPSVASSQRGPAAPAADTGTSHRAPSASQQPGRPAPHADSSASTTPNGGGSSSVPTGIGRSIASAFGVTIAALFALIEVLLLAFFLLAAGEGWSSKLRRVVRAPAEQQRVLEIVGEIHHVVLRYLLVNVIINACQGILVAILVWPLGYAAPVMWGVLTFIAEFIPYFGGAAMVALLFVTGLAAGQGLVHAVLAPVGYLIITTLQNNLVSPAAYGRGLRLEPAAILVAVMFWGIVWGVAGLFLAVPLLAAMRIIARQTDWLEPFAIFVSRRVPTPP